MIIINNSNTQVKYLILSCQYNLPKNEEKTFCLLLEDFWGKAKQMSTVMPSGYMCKCVILVYKWISIGADVGEHIVMETERQSEWLQYIFRT